MRFIAGIGLWVVVLGLAWPWLQRFGIGRLPGDIVIERGSNRFYFPITTSLLLSSILMLLF